MPAWLMDACVWLLLLLLLLLLYLQARGTSSPQWRTCHCLTAAWTL
jgi:hypothetical protein